MCPGKILGFGGKRDDWRIVKGNTDENNILDGETLEKVIEKIKEFSTKDFTKFSALIAVAFSIALWITRSMGYFYLSGRFLVYNIDKSYIDVWSNGFLIEVIRTISLCMVLGGINLFGKMESEYLKYIKIYRLVR